MRSRIDGFARTVLAYFFLCLMGILFLKAWASSGPVDPTADPQGFFDQVWSAATDRKWGLVAVLLAIAFVSFIRFIGPKLHGKTGAWLNSNRGGALSALVSGALSSLATAAMSGAKISPKLIVAGFVIGVGAIGGWNAFWDIFFPSDKKPAAGTTTSPPPPPIVRATLLLVGLGLTGLVLPSCASCTPEQRAGGAAFGSCMQGKGLQAGLSEFQQLPTQIDNVLGAPDSEKAAVDALEGLATKIGISGALDAVGCGVVAWQASHPLPKTGAVPAKLLIAHAACKSFLAKHPA